uniref:NFY protein n=1 Tax=Zingiber officinale TaxID=94328 RepID=A0AA50CC88_ZINOF|nr:NFY protein [Zingiber officinale]
MVPPARQRRMAEASQSNPAEGARSYGGGGSGGGGVSGGGGGDGGDGDSSVREQDRFLPIANITRILNKALPNHAKVAKETKETMQECVSEFISFITSEACERCMTLKKKTINGDDVLWSMATLGFEDYVPPLKLYLGKYRQGIEDSAMREMRGSYPNTYTTGENQVLQQNFLAQNMNYANHQDGEGSATREMGVSYPITNTTGEYQVLQQNFLAQNMNYANHQDGEGSASREMGVSHPITNTTGEYQVLQQNFLAQNMNYANHQDGKGSASREMGVSHPITNTTGEYQVLQQNFLAQNMNSANHQVLILSKFVKL